MSGNYLIDGMTAIVSLLAAEQNSMSSTANTSNGLNNCLTDAYAKGASDSSYWTSKVDAEKSSKHASSYVEEAQLATTLDSNNETTVNSNVQVATQTAQNLGTDEGTLANFVTTLLGPLQYLQSKL
jgi:hypothetical protein